jgi:hypothetical protein
MPTAPPASPGYPAGFVRGLHRAGIVSGALTLATAALLAAAAMAGQTPGPPRLRRTRLTRTAPRRAPGREAGCGREAGQARRRTMTLSVTVAV